MPYSVSNTLYLSLTQHTPSLPHSRISSLRSLNKPNEKIKNQETQSLTQESPLLRSLNKPNENINNQETQRPRERNIKPRHRHLPLPPGFNCRRLHCRCLWFGFSVLSSLVWVSIFVGLNFFMGLGFLHGLSYWVWVTQCNEKSWMRNQVCKGWFQFKWNRVLQTRFICHDPKIEFSELDLALPKSSL